MPVLGLVLFSKIAVLKFRIFLTEFLGLFLVVGKGIVALWCTLTHVRR